MGGKKMFFGNTGRNLLLDDLPLSHSAFSFRKLRRGYNGFCFRARRAIDSTFMDIGFVNGEMDVNALMTFASGGSAYVNIWYDQSGNNRDYQWSGLIYIVWNGVLITENSKPSIIFTPSVPEINSPCLVGTYDIGNNITGLSVFAVSKKTNTASGCLISYAHEGNLNQVRYTILYDLTSGKITLGGRRLISNSFQSITSSLNYTGNLEAIAGILDYENAAAFLYLNNNLVASSSTFQSSGISDSVNTRNNFIGKQSNSFSLSGFVSEIIIFEKSQIANVEVINNSQSSYYNL